MSAKPESRPRPWPTPAAFAAPVPSPQNGATALVDALEFAVQDSPPLSFDPAVVRARLAQRAAASVRASRAMVVVRHTAAAMARANRQARLQTLYLAAAGALRPGEPLQVLLIELAPDGRLDLDAPAPGVQREWLLLHGGAELVGAHGHRVALDPLDFHVMPAAGVASANAAAPDAASPATSVLHAIDAGAAGALLFLRESLQPPAVGEAPRTVRDADTPWQPYAPLVERRVLWQRGPMASLLYRAAAGAFVPQHAHGHDEECLVLRGAAFQDDCLLREGDYQLAPAGSRHLSSSTDVGAILYFHGDVEPDFTPHPTAAAAPAA